MIDPEQLWSAAQDELRVQVSRSSYEAWLKNARILDVDATGSRVRLGVPTELARDWVADRYAPLIRETLAAILAQDGEVELIVAVAPAPQPEDPGDAAPLTLAQVGDDPQRPRPDRTGAIVLGTLNPRYTFGAFVVGNSSRFAHAACKAVGDSPGRAYNPLFLYGGVGLGKTHLMHAIGHAVLEIHGCRVAYITSESFLNQMILAIQENRMADFRTRFRTVDVLLVDDIQFLAGKDRTQEEFFHTFNALHELGRQLVISSDRPPRDIPTLEDRLRTRFEGGLMADIQPPDFETRLAILRSKLGGEAHWLSEEVLSFIAHKIQKNIRELEGALIRLLAHASLTGGHPLSLTEVSQLLHDIIPTADQQPPTVEAIQEAVAGYYGISVEEMKSKRRDKHIVLPRQMAMFIIREEIAMSLPAIGQAFGGRDHTTVLHSCEKIGTDIKEDVRLLADLTRLRETLHVA
ncbi:MAG TPA: chromosomal replication initiator protein DnaA [Verrucomicrobiae bacterium]|nr:chromosomal replication initiator protein DnaA [Verrucomicrobiae bacterium]